jgi:hypothetical protein
MARLGVFVCLLSAVAFGCSATDDDSFSGSGGAGGATGAGGDGASGGGVTIGSGGDATVSVGSGGSGGGPPEIAEVYGHSASELYKLDPITKAVTTVGQFSGCPTAVIDIALDKDGFMVGTTFDGLYRIEKTTAQCSFIASGGYPNSLSYVPVGTLDPNTEALVGYNGSVYVRIDTTTGAISNVGGSIGGGLISSGDVVSVKGGGTYLTVKGANCNDCIVEVDPATGALVQNLGPLPYIDVFGLAFWGGSAYGFAGDQLFEVTFAGSMVMTMPIPLPNAPPGLAFYGAGSSTEAPLEPPPQ